MPSAAKSASNALINRESRSRSSKVMALARSVRSMSRLRAAWVAHAEQVCPATTVLDRDQGVDPSQHHGVHVHEVQARTALACAVRNWHQVGPDRPSAGSMPASCTICHQVEAAMR